MPLLTPVSQNHISSLEHLKTFVLHVQTTSEKLLFCSCASQYHFKSSSKISFCGRQEYYSSLHSLDVQPGNSGRGKIVIGVLWTCSHVDVFTLRRVFSCHLLLCLLPILCVSFLSGIFVLCKIHNSKTNYNLSRSIFHSTGVKLIITSLIGTLPSSRG